MAVESTVQQLLFLLQPEARTILHIGVVYKPHTGRDAVHNLIDAVRRILRQDDLDGHPGHPTDLILILHRLIGLADDNRFVQLFFQLLGNCRGGIADTCKDFTLLCLEADATKFLV